MDKLPVNQLTVKTMIKYWLPVFVYAVFIFYLSSIQSPDTQPIFPHFDKCVHFGLYFFLGILFIRAFTHQEIIIARHLAFWYSVLLTSGYGLTDEIHQYFVPSRHCDLWDFVADSIGGVSGISVYLLWIKK